MKFNYRFIAAVCILAGLVGCASVPMATPQQDAAAKQFAPVPGKALLYIYRNETFGAAVKMNVALDNRPVGQTASKTYFRLVLDPGHHTVDSQDGIATLGLDTQAGSVYYVWQEVKMGVWSARSALHLMDAGQGQTDVKECRLIQSTM